MTEAEVFAWWEQRFADLEAGRALAPSVVARAMLAVAARRLGSALGPASLARILGQLRAQLIVDEIRADRVEVEAEAAPDRRTVH